MQIKESTLSDQLFGGILPGLRKLTVTGTNLRRIEEQAFEGLQNCLHTELTITRTSVEEIPARIFELLLNAEWAKLDLSFNKISTLNSASLYPNSSFWFSKGTKLLQGTRYECLHICISYLSYSVYENAKFAKGNLTFFRWVNPHWK